MSVDLLQFFPYAQPRQIQKEALEALGASWDDFDVFVISAPTAFGKTAVAKTLMGAFHSVSCITPTNLLVEQFQAEFPDTPTLSRLDTYFCDKWKRPCSVTRGKCRNFCNRARDGVSCPASNDLATAKYRKGPGIYNYYTYLAHKLYRDVLVVDEAHNLLPTIRERISLRIWQHDYKYPHNMFTPEQTKRWIAALPPNKQKHQKIRLLLEAVTYDCPQYIVQRTEAEFAGKGTVRGEPEMRDCLVLLPVDISQAPPMFWPPNETSKIVLLSATIGPKDVEGLGLGGRGRRVQYIDCDSPITPGNRVSILHPVTSVNKNRMNEAVEILAKEINSLADQHIGEKGLIHATYQMSTLLRSRLSGSRYLFHDRNTKREMYQTFRASDPAEGKILVACGMYEGIDLPEDLGRWQVISKIPWQSLGNPAIAHLAKLDPEWYMWETIKTVIQACGRICRTPTDRGTTYILDSSIYRILNDYSYMLPTWWSDSLMTKEQYDSLPK